MFYITKIECYRIDKRRWFECVCKQRTFNFKRTDWLLINFNNINCLNCLFKDETTSTMTREVSPSTDNWRVLHFQNNFDLRHSLLVCIMWKYNYYSNMFFITKIVKYDIVLLYRTVRLGRTTELYVQRHYIQYYIQ